MTELDAVLSEVSKKAERERLERLAAALYAADRAGVKQVELVRRTGYTRETIRRHIEDHRIRRGEILPTKRYLKAQERRKRPAAGS